MASIGDVIASQTRRGLGAVGAGASSLGDYLSGIGKPAAGVPPSTPLPTITGPANVASPSVPNPTPTPAPTTLGGDPIPPQAAGYKPNFTVPDGSVPGMEGPGAPSARTAYGAKLAGTSSPEAQAYRAANPAVEAQVGASSTAPAAETAATAAQGGERALGRAATGLGRAAGVATRVASPLVSGAVTSTLAAAPLAGFGDYKINDPGVDSSAGGTIGNVFTGNFGAAGDGLRKGAVEAMLDSGSGFAKTGDFVAGLVGAHPNLAGKYDAMVRGDLGNQLLPGAQVSAAPSASAPTPASTAADPNTANAPGFGTTVSPFGTSTVAPLGLGAPGPGATPPAGPVGDPTSVPGIMRNGNSFTNVGTNADGSNGATTSSSVGGVDLNLANERQARANAINAAPVYDPNNLGTPGGSFVGNSTYAGDIVPRQTGTGGIGGLIVAGAARRDRALDLEQQRTLGGQDIQRQELGLRGQQFRAGQQLSYAQLGETQRHNLATAGLTQQQINREGQRDQALNDYHAGELKNTAARTAAEFGPSSLHEREFANTQDQQAITNHAKAGEDYSKSVAGSISTALRDDKGNVDPNLVAEHVSNANGQVTANIARLRAEVQANPSNTAAAKALDNYQRNGIAAMSDGEKERVQAATEFGQYARKYGSSDLNPIGGTNVEMRTPVASIKREGGLTGSVYRGYDANGKPLPITVPARAIETVDGNFVGGTRNQRFKSLIQGAQ